MLAVRTLMGSFAQVCSKCQGPHGAIHRQEWGCDEPTPNEQTRIPCFSCNDDTYGCPDCEDRRWLPVYRCPKSIREPYLEHVARIALWTRDGGPFPADGGSLDQSASFMDAREVALSACAEVEADELEERMKRKAGGLGG